MPRSLFTPQYKAFVTLLVEARETVGITQAELARRLHKPQPFVSYYERGQRRLDMVETIQICNALGINPVALLKRLLNTEPGKPRK